MVSTCRGPNRPALPNAKCSRVSWAQRLNPLRPGLVAGALQVNVLDAFAVEPVTADLVQQDAASAKSQGMSDAGVLTNVFSVDFKAFLENTLIVLQRDA